MKIFDDEIKVEMISAAGSSYGIMFMPKEMEAALIKAYISSNTVRTTYLYIDIKEIIDGVNYNSMC